MEQNEKSINPKDITESLLENITENRRRITAALRLPHIEYSKNINTEEQKMRSKKFFYLFSFSSCQNGDFCTPYMKGKTEHHFRKCERR